MVNHMNSSTRMSKNIRENFMYIYLLLLILFLFSTMML